jgi:hypothetical protein
LRPFDLDDQLRRPVRFNDAERPPLLRHRLGGERVTQQDVAAGERAEQAIVEGDVQLGLARPE